MQTLRKKILSNLGAVPASRIKIDIKQEAFAESVFNRSKIQKYLSQKAFDQMEQHIEKRRAINPILADQIAAAMKTWAVSKGATHYTHWFQPLTGSTAEKHDAFFETIGDGLAIEKFDEVILSDFEELIRLRTKVYQNRLNGLLLTYR